MTVLKAATLARRTHLGAFAPASLSHRALLHLVEDLAPFRRVPLVGDNTDTTRRIELGEPAADRALLKRRRHNGRWCGDSFVPRVGHREGALWLHQQRVDEHQKPDQEDAEQEGTQEGSDIHPLVGWRFRAWTLLTCDTRCRRPDDTAGT
jgi:hypothetical protein